MTKSIVQDSRSVVVAPSIIVNEKDITIKDVSDGVNFKLTFRRCVDERQMQLWYDLVTITQDIVFTKEDDSMIWELHSSGISNGVI